MDEGKKLRLFVTSGEGTWLREPGIVQVTRHALPDLTHSHGPLAAHLRLSGKRRAGSRPNMFYGRRRDRVAALGEIVKAALPNNLRGRFNHVVICERDEPAFDALAATGTDRNIIAINSGLISTAYALARAFLNSCHKIDGEFRLLRRARFDEDTRFSLRMIRIAHIYRTESPLAHYEDQAFELLEEVMLRYTLTLNVELFCIAHELAHVYLDESEFHARLRSGQDELAADYVAYLLYQRIIDSPGLYDDALQDLLTAFPQTTFGWDAFFTFARFLEASTTGSYGENSLIEVRRSQLWKEDHLRSGVRHPHNGLALAMQGFFRDWERRVDEPG